MNQEVRDFLTAMEGRIVEKLTTHLDEKFTEQAGIISKAFTHVETRLDERFDKVEARLDRIESILVAAQDRRIEQLEDSMRTVKTKLGIA